MVLTSEAAFLHISVAFVSLAASLLLFSMALASVEISSHIFNDNGLPLTASRFLRSDHIAILIFRKLFAGLAVLAASVVTLALWPP
jgi:hypothetical protein